MSLIESFGETLSGFSKALEALPRVAIDRIHDVENGPDILGNSVEIQFGPNLQRQAEHAAIQPESKKLISLDERREADNEIIKAQNAVDAAFPQPLGTANPVDLHFMNQPQEPDNFFEAA